MNAVTNVMLMSNYIKICDAVYQKVDWVVFGHLWSLIDENI